jgi:hypothetical protein
MGFEWAFAGLVVAFCGFDAAGSAATEASKHHRHALQLLSEECGVCSGV